MKYEQINLSALPTPQVIEELDFEVILDQRKQAFLDLIEDETEKATWGQRLTLESEPVVKLLEENAYREMLLRALINDRAKAVMLAFSTGNDLEHLGALFGVSRLIIQEADDSTTPKTEAIYESDDAFRHRIQMSLNGLTNAGTKASYEYHTYNVSGKIKDVSIRSDKSGNVNIAVLTDEMTEEETQNLLTEIDTALNAEDVRPLCDSVFIESAQIIDYEIQAEIQLKNNQFKESVLSQAKSNLEAFVKENFKLGNNITISSIYACLHIEGVEEVKIQKPINTIEIALNQAPKNTKTTLTIKD